MDLTKHQTVSMQIEKVGSDPFCEMSINSVVKEKIDVANGTTAKLSFLDCPNDDVRLTASQVIGKKSFFEVHEELIMDIFRLIKLFCLQR